MTRKLSTDHPAKGFVRIQESLGKGFPNVVWYEKITVDAEKRQTKSNRNLSWARQLLSLFF